MRNVWIILSTVLLAAAVRSQPAPNDGPRPADKPIDYASPELSRLEIFVGTWSVSETHFNPRGEVVAQAKGSEEILWVMDYHAIRRAYNSSGGAKTFRAFGLLTWNTAEKKYQGNWYDNSSTLGPTAVKGDWNHETKTLTLEVESTGTDGKTIRHRVVEKFDGAEKRTATTYAVDGPNLVKRIETVYKRTTPCPDRVRTFFGG